MNWRTSLAGLAGALGLAAQAVEDPRLKTIGLIVSVIAFALLGCTAKDAGELPSAVPKAAPVESDPPPAPPKG